MNYFACSGLSLNEVFDHLSKIGEFLTGISAVLVVIIGSKALREHWLIKRSNGASKALSLFRTCIDEILDIATRSALYQYPSFPSEISSGERHEAHPERPSRLIEMKVFQLNKDMHDPISQLSGKEGLQTLDLLAKLKQYYPHLSSAIYVSLKADSGSEAAKEQLKSIRSYLDGYGEELKNMSSEAEKILFPIIESINK